MEELFALLRRANQPYAPTASTFENRGHWLPKSAVQDEAELQTSDSRSRMTRQ